ncbi:malate synthase [Pseudoclavibacter endophyticus]|uniref:Malate synthase n=1 Tax=Pseudoclavibacter endophyticus TaxID=1778590 RepID=A0A6H9WQ04_9MICO|nr:malate synthase A [Pseudoclavibacter endophyticus]KAB1648191.1 malate synthase A [Pseudoclavibacter endophyticus]GGA70514.1 malate synthase [Pseudoclavibacter endophyticus]
MNTSILAPGARPSGNTTTAAARTATEGEALRGPAPYARRRSSIKVCGPLGERFDEILTPAAIRFITALHDRFADRRSTHLQHNAGRQAMIDRGVDPGFLSATAAIRDEPTWRVAPPASGLADRRVELTGPTDRQTAVEALESGAQVWLADHEDGLSPTWQNVIGGQVTLFDAIRGRIGNEPERAPTIVFRPRGWHLKEHHLRYVDSAGEVTPASGTLTDFGLYLFHNARELIARGTGPYFSLPKLENHLGARLWDDVFTFSENALGLDHGTIRATVLIETITAAFEMEEILYELRDHCAGLVAGRWDYLFSAIKAFRKRGRSYLLPDRRQITATAPFMHAFTELLVQTAHKRGAHAIGGMKAFIPDPNEPALTEAALTRIAAGKRREAEAGYDGTWVAHPGLIATASAEFDAVLQGRPNQLEHTRDDVRVTAADLLRFELDGSSITAEGIRHNVSVALRYLESWMRGHGSVAIDGLVEDASTAEISRSQLWHWIQQGALTEDNRPIVRERVEWVIDATLAGIDRRDGDRFDDAAELLRELALGDEFPAFLTNPAYRRYLG